MEYGYLTSQPGHLAMPSRGWIHLNARENMRYKSKMLPQRCYNNIINQPKCRKHYRIRRTESNVSEQHFQIKERESEGHRKYMSASPKLKIELVHQYYIFNIRSCSNIQQHEIIHLYSTVFFLHHSTETLHTPFASDRKPHWHKAQTEQNKKQMKNT